MKPASKFLKLHCAAAIAAAAVLLCACGQRGPLIHPDRDTGGKKASKAAPKPAAPTTPAAGASQPPAVQSGNASATATDKPAPAVPAGGALQ